MMLYQEYAPSPPLAPYLACLWTSHVHPCGSTISHRVLPDNCIDILWQDCAPEGRVSGMMSSAMHVPFAHPVRTVAVRFKPGAASWFFDLPLHHLIDRHPSLADLWEAGAAGQFADALWSRPLSDLGALAAIEPLLLERLHKRLRSGALLPGLVEHAVAALQASKGDLRIESLAAKLGVSRQHLATQFRNRVGLGAKQFARVCRFQHASARLKDIDPGRVDMAALALDLGYYDQPHMNHEFRALSGSTPLSFMAMD